MNKQLRFIILLFLLISAGLPTAFGQATFASEEELKQQAFKLFEEDEFEEAYPLYSQLVSIYPKDANYNYRLGVCMLYASDDKEKAIPFLEFSAKKPDVEKEAIFYLAKAYHLNYRFDDAIGQYMAYAKVASESKANKLQVERQIEMCRSGKKLLRNITDLLVIDKKELSRTDFYRAYDISDIGGKLLAKPDEESFRTPLDKKKKEKSIIYLATNNNQVFFSSYGDDLEHGKDIYVIRKLPSGEWSKSQTLGYPVNTEYDEDFPFLHPNGKVLYFCSKGHNSMGGYDIFKTTLNEETNTWNKPVNLDFPINTPDDDILYVTNEDEKEAFFSSARSSKTGKTAVFHINVERKPIDVAIIKGFVIKTKDEQALDVKITVKDLGDNTILGIYNAKESGSYLINLPNGGRFMYTVEAAGFNTQSEIVLLPTQYEFKPLKQEISYEPGTDKLIIKNLFDEPVDDQSYLLALNFIKSKSKLEAGVDAANAAAKNNNNTANEENTSGQTADTKTTSPNTSKTTDTKTNSTSGSLSNDAIVKIAYDDAKEAEKEAKDLQEQADIALTLASQKNELAQNKAKEATQLMADANSMTDNVKKQTVVEEANQASAESEELNQETVAAFNIAKKLQQKAAAKDEEAGLSLDYAKALEAAVKSKSPADALEKLKEQEQKLDALSEKNGTAEPDNIYAGLKMDADVKKRELDKVTQVSADIKQEIADNNTLMATLQSDADKTKKEDLKKGILEQIEGLKADSEESKKDLEANEQKLAKLSKEYNGIKNELELVSNVVDKAKVETNEAAAASVAAIDKTKLEAQVNEIKNTPIDDAVAINKANSNSSADNAAKNVITETNNSNNSVNAAKTNDVATNTATDVNKNNENKSSENNSVNTNSNKSTEITDNSNSVTNKSTEEKTSENNSSVTKENYSNNFNNELAALSNNPATIENSTKKVELYNSWVAAITNDLTEKKALAKTEKDKTKKKALTAEIAALENELKTKQTEEKAAVANVEKIKKENVVTDNSSNPALNSSNSDNVSNTALNTSQSLSSINQTFTDQLAVADKITKASEREDAKAVILKDWSTAINNNIEKQKQDMTASTDPEMKALLEKKIRDAETLAKEKESLAIASTNQAKKLKEQEGNIAANSAENKSSDAATNNDVNNTTEEASTNNTKSNETNIAANSGNESSDSGNSISNKTEESRLIADQKLKDAIVEAENAGTEREREAKKAEAFRFYITAANDQIASKQNELKEEKNNDKKRELNAEIVALQSEVKNKQVLVNESEQKLKALENIPVDVAVNSTDVAATSNKSISKEGTLKSEETKVADNSTSSEESNKASEVKTENKIIYTNTLASEKSKAAVAADKEAERLITQATDLKAEAAEKNTQAEKNALYIKANELNSQAEVKKTEAAQLTSDANYSEFIANKDQLEQIAAATSGNNSDQVAMAEMMKDESATYFERAQKSRAIAGSVTSVTDKLTALEDAVANEKIALDKQRRATEIYKKANPTFVAVVNNNQNNTENSNVQNKTETNKTNDVAVNQNKSADNSVSADPTKTNDVSANTNKSTQLDNNSKTAEERSADNNDANSDQSTTADKTNSSDNKTNIVTNEVKTSDNTNSNTLENSDPIKVSDASKSTEIAVNENKSNTENTTTTADQVKTIESATNIESNNANKSSDIAKNETGTNENAALVNDAAKTSETLNNNNNTSSTNLSKVVLAPTEKYERTTQPVYSASKPIPVNEALPDGLIYKVQIGAFRNPIAPEQFDGMSPLTAETTPQGFTRYTAGLFTKYSTADQVKNEIRQLGYKDAFVVIFLNGKRISIGEAMKLQSQDPTITVAATGIISDNSTQTENNANPLSNNSNTANPANTTSTPVNASTPAVSENVEVVSGLFYTVQVGVYSQAVSSSKLFNIQPLYTENTANGNIRYNTGIFNNVQRAVEAKNIVITAGVKDAFVTAYYKGKRISLAEAAALDPQGGAIFSTDANINKLPTTGAGSVSPVNTNPVSNQPETGQVPAENKITPVSPATNQPVTLESSPVTSELKNTISQNTVLDSGVVFKVQIGAFKEEVPVSIANQFLQIAKKGIKNYKDQNGLTIYTLGSFKTYEEALQLKNEITSTVTDAFVVAYNNGNKISLDEAKTLQKK